MVKDIRWMAKRYIRVARQKHLGMQARLVALDHAHDLEYVLRSNGSRTGDLQRSLAFAKRRVGQ